MKRIVTFLFCLVSIAATAGEFSAIPNLHAVDAGIYRGGRPDFEGLRQLKAAGLKTIVNIEDHPEHIENSREWAETLGLKFISLPISWMEPPTDELVNSIMDAIKSPHNQPVLINCKHGRDRTGMIIGLYRVFSHGWEPPRAYQEMLDFGFRPEFVDLDQYFKEKTGFDGNGSPR